MTDKLTDEQLRHRNSARPRTEANPRDAMVKVALALGVPFVPEVRQPGSYVERNAAYEANKAAREKAAPRKRPVKS